VTGRVTLSPELQARVSAGDTLFVFARAVEGPRMPLAILRKTAADLPMSFTLDDSMAMSPAMKLSNFPRVVVGARISKSGNAMPSPGDLTGQVSDVKVGAEGLQIVIDSVQP
jgi:cytochrome c-type biogenesis protein CcmH